MQLEFEFLPITLAECGAIRQKLLDSSNKIFTINEHVALMVSNEANQPILKLHRDGRVEAKTVEDATEAGRIFVQAVRSQLAATGW